MIGQTESTPSMAFCTLLEAIPRAPLNYSKPRQVPLECTGIVMGFRREQKYRQGINTLCEGTRERW
jgi:hypothetical protein